MKPSICMAPKKWPIPVGQRGGRLQYTRLGGV
jgi:hypothetical protein